MILPSITKTQAQLYEALYCLSLFEQIYDVSILCNVMRRADAVRYIQLDKRNDR